MMHRSIPAGLLGLLIVAALPPRVHAAPSAPVRILVEKSARKMTLLRGDAPIKTYRIALGFEPTGAKTIEGDGKTPEGRYHINFKNARSAFHLSLKISYPNAAQSAKARAAGASAGGDIFIHGTPGQKKPYPAGAVISDWTLGCIAVTNDEIDEIWALVPVGAEVTITP